MKIGLLFGSFNPVHCGHLIIANYCLAYAGMQAVWMVLSPHNPLKCPGDLMPQERRLLLLRTALQNYSLPIEACDVEFRLPKPSYTIDTIAALRGEHPGHEFSLIMGADSLASIEQWKDWKMLIGANPVLVYPRVGFDAEALCRQYKVQFVPAPMVEISSTMIRKAMQEKKDLSTFMPAGVAEMLR